MRLSLRYRLLIPLSLLLVVEVAATAGAAVMAARAAERQLTTQQWAVARTLAESTFPLRERVLQQMKGLSGAEFLLTRDERPVESTFPEPKPPPPVGVPRAAPPDAGSEESPGAAVVVGGNPYRCLRLPLRPPHPDAGCDLFIFYPEAMRRSVVRDAVRPLLLLGGAGGVLAIGLAMTIGGRLVARIRDLEARTRLIAAGDFRPMPLPRSDDELRDLCRSVNDMARRLAAYQHQLQRDERWRVLGQVSGGLAHQLRNAATGAKLAVELFLSENPVADPEPLRVALDQLARIEANLRQFLTLGRPPGHACGPCDLVEVIEQCVSLARPRCRHIGTTLVWERSPEPCMIPGDAVQLGHLFGNLIGNAVEAAGPGGRVELRIIRSGSELTVEVIDTGPGPPDALAARLFEPFVTGKDQGIGLGLAVAKQAAEAHNASLTWQRRGDTTVFRVSFPVAAPGPLTSPPSRPSPT